jgi:hypothetical protein
MKFSEWSACVSVDASHSINSNPRACCVIAWQLINASSDHYAGLQQFEVIERS